MDRDRDIPPPPTLDAAEDDEYHRGEIQIALEDGAWEAAFQDWLATTDIEADAFEIAEDLDLFDDFDFFWDDFAQRVGFFAPGIPDDWEHAGYHDELTSWRQASSINGSLAELGQTVCDVLQEDYLDLEEEDWGDDLDLPSFD